ncbi:MAG: hypothetical protein ACXWVS_02720 [Hyphomicrobium sp.]
MTSFKSGSRPNSEVQAGYARVHLVTQREEELVPIHGDEKAAQFFLVCTLAGSVFDDGVGGFIRQPR